MNYEASLNTFSSNTKNIFSDNDVIVAVVASGHDESAEVALSTVDTNYGQMGCVIS